MIYRLFFVFFMLFAGAASAAEWVVERATKNVSVSVDGASWRAVKTGDAIPNGHWLRTGPRARLLLSKGSERIMYRENTLAAIAVSQPTGKKTQVTQRRGSILLAVKKRRRQHTSVVTPHLAAVVKGTVFEVVVDPTQSDVRVDRGLVQVSSENQSVNVSSGNVARVDEKALGIEVAQATVTSITPNGRVGLSLAEIKSDGNAGGNDKSNAGGNGKGNSGGNGKSHGNGKGNSGSGNSGGGNKS